MTIVWTVAFPIIAFTFLALLLLTIGASASRSWRPLLGVLVWWTLWVCWVWIGLFEPLSRGGVRESDLFAYRVGQYTFWQAFSLFCALFGAAHGRIRARNGDRLERKLLGGIIGWVGGASVGWFVIFLIIPLSYGWAHTAGLYVLAA